MIIWLISLKKETKAKNQNQIYLNNVTCDLGRLKSANFVDVNTPSVIKFNSESDANTLCNRIEKYLKIKVKAVLFNNEIIRWSKRKTIKWNRGKS